MKKIILQTIMQTIMFVIIYTIMGYFLSHSTLSFLEYSKFKLSQSFVLTIIMSIAFFLGNYFAKNDNLTWKDIINKFKKY